MWHWVMIHEKLGKKIGPEPGKLKVPVRKKHKCFVKVTSDKNNQACRIYNSIGEEIGEKTTNSGCELLLALLGRVLQSKMTFRNDWMIFKQR